MFNAFLRGGLATLTTGLSRSLKLLFSEGHWLWLALLLVLCLLLFLLAGQGSGREERPSSPLAALVVGFLMALAPVTIFFVLDHPWFSLRGTVPSFCGAALMADTLFSLCLGRVRLLRRLTAGVCAVLALWFSLSSLSELHDYRATWADDTKAMTAICSATDNGLALGTGTAGILGLNPSYLEEQTFPFHEHIHGVTESGWALTGALQYASGNGAFPPVSPLPEATSAARFQTLEPTFSSLWLYDHTAGTLVPVRAVLSDDWNYDILSLSEGTLLGRVTARGLERAEIHTKE